MRSRGREVKVGLLVIVALAVLATGIFLLGEKEFLFARTSRYFVQFQSVGGLNTGNPVQLNGVEVGRVEEIVLPEQVENQLLVVWIAIDRRYADRVRADSQARIKTLGLLGDKYVAITSGSPDQPVIPTGAEIPAAPLTDVDQLIASGEDVVESVVAISHSMATILGRMERGEGLIGALIADTAEGKQVRASLVAAIESFERAAAKLDSGEGALPRLLNDPALANRLEHSLDRLDGILTQVETGEGLLPGLLNDAETRAKFDATFDNLNRAVADLSGVTRDFREGDGLLPRLLNDEAYGREVSEELKSLLEKLNLLSERMTEGQGSVAQLLNDPQVYEAINDVLVGINESKLLRWLIRNRQKAGIKKRYKDTKRELEEAGIEPVEEEGGPR